MKMRLKVAAWTSPAGGDEVWFDFGETERINYYDFDFVSGENTCVVLGGAIGKKKGKINIVKGEQTDKRIIANILL